jgi:hypothetical protein
MRKRLKKKLLKKHISNYLYKAIEESRTCFSQKYILVNKAASCGPSTLDPLVVCQKTSQCCFVEWQTNKADEIKATIYIVANIGSIYKYTGK